MLSNLLIFKKNVSVTRQSVQFLRVKALTFWFLVWLKSRKNEKSLVFVYTLFVCAAVQHKHKRDLEFVIVIVA
jgi:hypothetical protein